MLISFAKNTIDFTFNPGQIIVEIQFPDKFDIKDSANPLKCGVVHLKKDLFPVTRWLYTLSSKELINQYKLYGAKYKDAYTSVITCEFSAFQYNKYKERFEEHNIEVWYDNFDTEWFLRIDNGFDIKIPNFIAFKEYEHENL